MSQLDITYVLAVVGDSPPQVYAPGVETSLPMRGESPLLPNLCLHSGGGGGGEWGIRLIGT